MEGTHETKLSRAGIYTKLLGLLVSLSALFGAAATAQAATLLFSPTSGEYAVGKTFSVSVFVSSADQAMNAVSGIISFPQDKLEVASVSKSGSIISLWVQEPSFLNTVGTINFEGIVLNPGFTGGNGRIVTVQFRVKAAGIALLHFFSGAVLANDGKGTNILMGLGKAQFSLGGAVPLQPTPPSAPPPSPTAPPAVPGVPSAPRISSPTHPDPNKWYAKKDAQFVWPVPSGVTAARLLFGGIARAAPTIMYTPAVSHKEITNLADGIWYFHVQLRNESGWGEVSHFRFQVDTEKPTRFDIAEIPRKDLTEPNAAFMFDAADTTSGIDHFEVQIDSGSVETWRDDGSHRYVTPAMQPGKHTLAAKAVDRAGNALANSAAFIVEALNPPVITEYPKVLQSGETLVVRGSTYPLSKAVIWLQKEKEDPRSFTIESDQNGAFTFTADEKPEEGTYQLWAEAMNARGEKSLPSGKVAFAVVKAAVPCVERWSAASLAVAASLAALIILILLSCWRGWYKLLFFRERLRKKAREAESVLHRAFDVLRDTMREKIALLDKTRTKQQLTEEEGRIVRQLKKDLNDAEKMIRKEIEDIEREVK